MTAESIKGTSNQEEFPPLKPWDELVTEFGRENPNGKNLAQLSAEEWRTIKDLIESGQHPFITSEYFHYTPPFFVKWYQRAALRSFTRRAEDTCLPERRTMKGFSKEERPDPTSYNLEAQWTNLIKQSGINFDEDEI